MFYHQHHPPHMHHPQHGHHHPHGYHPYHSKYHPHTKADKPSVQEMRRKCHDHLHRYVVVHTDDDRAYDGIVAEVDREHLHLAVPITGDDAGSRPESETANEARQYPYGAPYGFGYPYGGFGPGYFRPRRRFRRVILPLAALTALSILPYWY